MVEIEIKADKRIRTLEINNSTPTNTKASSQPYIASDIGNLLSIVKAHIANSPLLNNRFIKGARGKAKGLLNRYNEERTRIEKIRLQEEILNENKKQTEALEELEKKKNSSSKGSGIFGILSKGVGYLLSLVGLSTKTIGAIFGLSTLLKKLPFLNKIIPNNKGKKDNKDNKGKKDNKGNKGKKAKTRGGIGKGLLKKAGIIGAIIGGISGIADYKEWKGLSEEYNTTIREKITGALGGIANGFKDFVNFVSMGTVNLWEDNEAFQLLDTVTENIKQSITNILSGFPKIEATFNILTDGINNLLNTSADGLKNIYEWGKEFTRKQSFNEKEFVKIKNKREKLEELSKDTKNFMESDEHYKERIGAIKQKLLEVKELELILAKKALEDKDFREKSRFKDEAILVVQKAEAKRYDKEVSKYEEWNTIKNKAQSKVEGVNSEIIRVKKILKDKTISESERKVFNIKLESLTIALENLGKDLNKVMKEKPTVTPYDSKSHEHKPISFPKHKPMNRKENFQLLRANAEVVAKELGIDPRVIIAQQIQENGWKKKKLTGKNNFFNIKADKSWKGKKSKHRVWEIKNGKKVWQEDWFRDYDDPAQSAKDYAKFLKKNKRYSKAISKAKNGASGEEFIDEVAKAGYATDPNYAKNIKSIMHGRTFKKLYAETNIETQNTNHNIPKPIPSTIPTREYAKVDTHNIPKPIPNTKKDNSEKETNRKIKDVGVTEIVKAINNQTAIVATATKSKAAQPQKNIESVKRDDITATNDDSVVFNIGLKSKEMGV